MGTITVDTGGERTTGDYRLSFAELIARLEMLTAPDRELDSLIWCAVFAPADAHVLQSRINGAWCIYHGTNHRTSQPRLYEHSRVLPVTESIDAAMTLVGGRLRMLSNELQPDMGGKQWSASVHDGGNFRATARTAALAICIAALKAGAALASVRMTAPSPDQQ